MLVRSSVRHCIQWSSAQVLCLLVGSETELFITTFQDFFSCSMLANQEILESHAQLVMNAFFFQTSWSFRDYTLPFLHKRVRSFSLTHFDKRRLKLIYVTKGIIQLIS